MLQLDVEWKEGKSIKMMRKGADNLSIMFSTMFYTRGNLKCTVNFSSPQLEAKSIRDFLGSHNFVEFQTSIVRERKINNSSACLANAP